MRLTCPNIPREKKNADPFRSLPFMSLQVVTRSHVQKERTRLFSPPTALLHGHIGVKVI